MGEGEDREFSKVLAEFLCGVEKTKFGISDLEITWEGCARVRGRSSQKHQKAIRSSSFGRRDLIWARCLSVVFVS